ncbi:MAG: peptidyl-prolyl cis-trans isomerase [Deltaproteobacteria bacterium]|nr:peptidyl-prolyl cis-trans isomerase [Deltaproteobacteria bacterium]
MPVSCLKPEKESQKKITPGQAQKPASVESKFTEEERALVVAKIGERTITLGEIEEKLNSQPAYVRMRYTSPERRKEFIESLIEFELIAAEAFKSGYDKSPEVMEILKQEMAKRFEKNEIEAQVKITDITEEEMKKYYADNSHLFNREPQKRLSHILLKDGDEAQKVHQALVKEIAANADLARKAFSDFAEKYSADEATKKNGGDLGFIPRTAEESSIPLPPDEVVKEAGNLEKIFAISGVVKSGQGYHIIMLTGEKPEIKRSFEEVKRQIQNKLWRDRKNAFKEEFLKKLREQAKVEINGGAIEKIEKIAPQGGDKEQLMLKGLNIKGVPAVGEGK